jgi:hypothetical protein
MARRQAVEVQTGNGIAGSCADQLSMTSFGRLCYPEPNSISHAIGYATYGSRSHHAVIFVDPTGNVIETHEQAGDLKEW